MNKIKFVIICLFFGSLAAHAQDIKLVKAASNYPRIGAYDYRPLAPYIWTKGGVLYYNQWYYEKPQQKMYLVDFSNDFTVTMSKGNIEHNGQTYGVKNFVKYSLGGEGIQLVNVLNQKSSTHHYYKYHLEGEKIMLDREVLSLKKGEVVRRTKVSPNKSFIGIYTGETWQSLKEEKCSFVILDSALNTVEQLSIDMPQTKESTTSFKDFSISSTGKMSAVFYHTDEKASFLYVQSIENESKPIYLDFEGVYTFNNADINFYNNDDANIVISYKQSEEACGYVIFDTKNEDEGRIKGNFFDFNQNFTKYLYESPYVMNVYTFPENLQVYIFQTDLKKGSNRLTACLKVVTLSDKGIVSQYDAIRDVGSDYGGFIGDCYLIYRNDYLYVLFSGLKGKGEEYSFEEVAKRNKDKRMIKYLKISSTGTIEEFDVDGTEGLYLDAVATDYKGDKILARAYTFMALGMGGNYGDANFVELSFHKN